MRSLLTFPALALALFCFPAKVVAQDGCQMAQRSCSQMNAVCESNCQKTANNPAACIARACTQSLVGCKANGVWKGAAASACWRTNNRS